MEYFKLNNGELMPKIGMGTNTFGKEGHDFYADINFDTTELKSAIEAGYRHFDTAIAYRNEAVIGKAVLESGLPRNEFFLTSKIPGTPEGIKDEETIRKNVAESAEALGGYIDLYLIHHPWDDNADMLRAWRVLEGFVDNGAIKSLGVSNYSAEQLDYLVEHARIKPTTNQIKIQSTDWNQGLIDASLKLDIIPVAWSPLNRLPEEIQEKINEIGRKYNKTWAQVILNYLVNQNVAVIPKSHNADRQKENFDIFDFTLSDEDIQFLKTMND